MAGLPRTLLKSTVYSHSLCLSFLLVSSLLSGEVLLLEGMETESNLSKKSFCRRTWSGLQSQRENKELGLRKPSWISRCRPRRVSSSSLITAEEARVISPSLAQVLSPWPRRGGLTIPWKPHILEGFSKEEEMLVPNSDGKDDASYTSTLLLPYYAVNLTLPFKVVNNSSVVPPRQCLLLFWMTKALLHLVTKTSGFS